MQYWRIPLTDRKPPLNLNDRGHWAKAAPIKARLREEARWQARSAGIPRGVPHIHTRLYYRAPDRRHRDEDNIIATAKPLWDGLVDAGIVADDTSAYMTKYMPRILPPEKGKPPAMWLDVWIPEET